MFLVTGKLRHLPHLVFVVVVVVGVAFFLICISTCTSTRRTTIFVFLLLVRMLVNRSSPHCACAYAGLSCGRPHYFLYLCMWFWNQSWKSSQRGLRKIWGLNLTFAFANDFATIAFWNTLMLIIFDIAKKKKEKAIIALFLIFEIPLLQPLNLSEHQRQISIMSRYLQRCPLRPYLQDTCSAPHSDDTFSACSFYEWRPRRLQSG